VRALDSTSYWVSMPWKPDLNQTGVVAALAAAVLFGSGTALAKGLLININPWLLAALLYLGSGLGLMLYRGLRRLPGVGLQPGEWPWLAGAIFMGGVVGPLLLMIGLTAMPASGASLLLNAESVFTALLAWFVFRENFDRRIALGMAAIIAGAFVLSWPENARLEAAWPAWSVLGACLAWGIDNNLTCKVSLADASWLASIKGLSAGTVNLILAMLLGTTCPPWLNLVEALVVGWFAYGVSLTLFVVGLRHLGTARTGAYFSIAPFFGALLSILWLDEPVDGRLLLAGGLMAVGVWLHLTEQHSHEHLHQAIEHTHDHEHDEHHQHTHSELAPPGVKHTHRHRHEPITHSHQHFPDLHHRHGH
jgi:drug/metabolite transporter (DMT)-like permease